MISRREFIRTLTVAATGSGLVKAAMAAAPTGDRRFAARLGVQLYSLNAQLEKDVPGPLKHIREVGYMTVETAGFYGLKT